MIKVIKEIKETPVKREVDVLVVGGGPGGITAAIAAARSGLNVHLVERYGCLGGLSSAGLVLLMDCLFDRQGKRWINGIFWEIMERLKTREGLAWDNPTWVNVESELYKITAEEMCLEAGVSLQYHTWVVDSIVENNTVKGAITESKSGREAVLSKVCIDASGDGDVAAFSGAHFSLGKMPIGLNMKIAGVNTPVFKQFIETQKEHFSELMSELKKNKGYEFDMHATAGSEIGIFWVNNPGIIRRVGDSGSKDLLSAIDAQDLSYVEIELRKRLYYSFNFYRENIPGFEKANLVTFASQLGIRDSRHIKGLDYLEEQYVRRRVWVKDSIGMACVNYAGDVDTFQIPYGCLVPQGIDGLLTAGRCISVDHWIINAVRLIPACMMIGEAAGTAAALAVINSVEPQNLPYKILEDKLLENQVILSPTE